MVRKHVRVTMQPFDAPPKREQLDRIIEEIGCDDMFLFSTDYPHWQFDGTDAVPAACPKRWYRKMLFDNPMET